jgi:hypothetical protein
MIRGFAKEHLDSCVHSLVNDKSSLLSKLLSTIHAFEETVFFVANETVVVFDHFAT